MSDIVARLRSVESRLWTGGPGPIFGAAGDEGIICYALPEILRVVEAVQEYATYEDLTLNPCPMCSPDDPEPYRAARIALHQALCPLKAK